MFQIGHVLFLSTLLIIVQPAPPVNLKGGKRLLFGLTAIPSDLWLVGTTNYGKSYFTESFTDRTWQEAKEYCAVAGLRLATVVSVSEFNLLKSKYDVNYFSGGYWIGGRDAFAWRQFSWDDSDEQVSPNILGSITHNLTYPYQSCLYYFKTAATDHVYFHSCERRKLTLCESMGW